MAGQSQFLTDWVRNAYSMEMGLIPVLENQAKEVRGDARLQEGINHHLHQTRQHADLLRGCLERMGENVSALRPSDPIMAGYGRSNGGGQDTMLKTELIDFVTKSFEVASYRALSALARQAGDEETVRVCRQILQDETAMMSALDRDLPDTVAPAGQSAGMEQQNARIARDNFELINQKNLERWRQDYTADFKIGAPGAPGPLDRDQFRDYVQNFMTAFPDLHFDIKATIAQGDHVVMNWKATGTHNGPLRTPAGETVSPTHRKVQMPGSTTEQIQDGKIVCAWTYWDMGTLMDTAWADEDPVACRRSRRAHSEVSKQVPIESPLALPGKRALARPRGPDRNKCL